MSYRLFLDDCRDPQDCLHYMHKRVGKDNLLYMEEWKVVRNYDEFVTAIKEYGVPEVVSFDHDLAVEHYRCEISSKESWEEYQKWEGREKTGYDCGVFLHEYCYWHKIPEPKVLIHTMNPVGLERIHLLFFQR
jgi:hypothetical protein